uniref:Uncharacterized protein n=1 Tax=Arundo donax TaxID=35708 RepID=A0A0A9FYX8_ARUDO
MRPRVPRRLRRPVARQVARLPPLPRRGGRLIELMVLLLAPPPR